MQNNTPIDVNTSSITPISKKEIGTVSPTKWAQMSAGELSEEITVLQNRAYMLQQMQKSHMLPQLQQTIKFLQELINERLSGGTTI